jgi:predicted Zn-dependent protease
MGPELAELIGSGALVAWLAAVDVTPEKEAALGRHLAAEMRSRSTALESPRVREFVERTGGPLASQMPGGISFTLGVIAEDPCQASHEPPAFPGGYVFVPAALFLEARDEAEFGAVLAHAMAHIAAHHGMRQAAQRAVVNYAGIPLIFMGAEGGFCDSGAAAVPQSFLTSLAGFEREADFLAVQTLSRAGFDPGGLARYVERVQPPGASRDARVAAISEEIARLPQSGSTASRPDNFAAIQREVRSLVQQHQSPEPPRLRRKAP